LLRSRWAQDRLRVVDIELIGEVDFPAGFTFAGTEVGGLSVITYDPRRKIYWASSNDRCP